MTVAVEFPEIGADERTLDRPVVYVGHDRADTRVAVREPDGNVIGVLGPTAVFIREIKRGIGFIRFDRAVRIREVYLRALGLVGGGDRHCILGREIILVRKLTDTPPREQSAARTEGDLRSVRR